MADTLRWSPTEFWTPTFDAAQTHLRRTADGNFALSAGRTWSMCSVPVDYIIVGSSNYEWRPYRFNMGSAATPRNFVVVAPDGFQVSRSSQTPAVNPVITTANIA